MKNLSNEYIEHLEKDGIQYIQFKKLLEYNIKHCFTMKPLDFSVLNSLDNVKQNYKTICEIVGLNYNGVIKPIQANLDGIKIVNEKVNSNEPDIYLDEYKDIDGLITNKNHLAISTTNADCVIILMYDPVKKVIANIHSGWRGTIKRIAEKAIFKMKDEYNCNIEDIICCMTPSIRECHFEVDEDVKDIFEQEYKDILNKNIIKAGELKDEVQFGEVIKKQKYTINIPLIIKTSLENVGVTSNNIIDSNVCSVCENRHIHSKRGDNLLDLQVATAIIEIS